MGEAVADPQIASRGVLHRFGDGAPGVPGPFSVPVAAFVFDHDGPRVDAPPPRLGEHTEQVLGELGYGAADVARFRAARVI
jgi:crotonobetainyl-CoA:carnitine CoA-transferase CaiB-like acyl-CoA transferase